MTDTSNNRDDSVEPPSRAQRRARDFRVIGGVAVVVLLVLAVAGQATWVSALLGGVIVVAACIGWFFGTVDPAIDTEVEDTGGAAAEARRRADAERRFRVALIEALPETAIYIDAQGKVEAANAAARRQFRFVVADPMLTAAPARRPELLDAVAARAPGEPQRFEIMQRDETDQHFSCIASPLGSGVRLSLHDFTDIKRMELARVDFLANASHELRTPLTSLSGFIETMRGPARDDPEARDRFLEIMQGQADRMRRLISDLLSLSRIELVEHRPPEGEADLAAVVIEARDAWRRSRRSAGLNCA